MTQEPVPSVVGYMEFMDLPDQPTPEEVEKARRKLRGMEMSKSELFWIVLASNFAGFLLGVFTVMFYFAYVCE